MFDHNGQRTRIQPRDVILFKHAPGAGTLISIHRPLATEEEGSKDEQRLVLEKYGLPYFALGFLPFDVWPHFAELLAEMSGFVVGVPKITERGDLYTAEFEVHEAT